MLVRVAQKRKRAREKRAIEKRAERKKKREDRNAPLKILES